VSLAALECVTRCARELEECVKILRIFNVLKRSVSNCHSLTLVYVLLALLANVSPSANEEATSGAMQHASHACGDRVATQRTHGSTNYVICLRCLLPCVRALRPSLQYFGAVVVTYVVGNQRVAMCNSVSPTYKEYLELIELIP
jgi:hypothetical protein